MAAREQLGIAFSRQRTLVMASLRQMCLKFLFGSWRHIAARE
jgi:hypothetical protein